MVFRYEWQPYTPLRPKSKSVVGFKIAIPSPFRTDCTRFAIYLRWCSQNGSHRLQNSQSISFIVRDHYQRKLIRKKKKNRKSEELLNNQKLKDDIINHSFNDNDRRCSTISKIENEETNSRSISGIL
jgi:hypothetical protein